MIVLDVFCKTNYKNRSLFRQDITTETEIQREMKIIGIFVQLCFANICNLPVRNSKITNFSKLKFRQREAGAEVISRTIFITNRRESVSASSTADAEVTKIASKHKLSARSSVHK